MFNVKGRQGETWHTHRKQSSTVQALKCHKNWPHAEFGIGPVRRFRTSHISINIDAFPMPSFLTYCRRRPIAIVAAAVFMFGCNQHALRACVDGWASHTFLCSACWLMWRKNSSPSPAPPLLGFFSVDSIYISIYVLFSFSWPYVKTAAELMKRNYKKAYIKKRKLNFDVHDEW